MNKKRAQGVVRTINSENRQTDYLQYIRKITIRSTSTSYFKLISKFGRKFDLTRTESRRIIDSLIDEKYLILINDTIRVNLMANPIRKQIFDFITNYPGIYINELKKQVGIESGQLLWHLSILLNANLIEEHKMGNLTAYGLRDVSKSQVKIGLIVLKNSMRCILEYMSVQSLNIRDQKKVAKIGLKKGTLAYNFKKLKEYGLVMCTESDPNTYFITSELDPIIQKAIRDFYQFLLNT